MPASAAATLRSVPCPRRPPAAKPRRGVGGDSRSPSVLGGVLTRQGFSGELVRRKRLCSSNKRPKHTDALSSLRSQRPPQAGPPNGPPCQSKSRARRPDAPVAKCQGSRGMMENPRPETVPFSIFGATRWTADRVRRLQAGSARPCLTTTSLCNSLHTAGESRRRRETLPPASSLRKYANSRAS